MSSPTQLRPLRMGLPHPQGPAATITRRAADRLRAGHLWVYRTDIELFQPAAGAQAVPGEGGGVALGGALGGTLVTVLDARGVALGTAIFSAASQITLRLVSPVPQLSREQYLADIEARVYAALALRESLSPAGEDNNAHRLIFSEADNLPGIIADRYNDLVILQLLTQATAQADVRETVTRVIETRLRPTAILERPDPRIRELEELPALEPTPDTALKSQSVFTINGLHFSYDAGTGQKTGAFLDQRVNYAAAAAHAHGKALDVCTYQGGFALHLAQVCDRVTGVDSSRAALKVADANLLLNPALAERNHTDWIEADAFDLLRDFESTGQRYDTIVLDPPAFAKSKRAMEGALRGYKELNLRALKMLNPGGTLVSCSCSHHVSLPEFTDVLTAAAADSHRRVQLLEVRGAAPDHPAILTLPETSYLKCLIVRVK